MIISSAIKIKLKNSNENIIIHCHRHLYGYFMLKQLGFKPEDYERVSSGFINHKGTYMTREQAYVHALECGQIPATVRELKEKNKSKELFSEDIF